MGRSGRVRDQRPRKEVIGNYFFQDFSVAAVLDAVKNIDERNRQGSSLGGAA
jgi:hypothetical protein